MNQPKVNLTRKMTRRDTTAGLLQPFVASGTAAKIDSLSTNPVLIALSEKLCSYE